MADLPAPAYVTVKEQLNYDLKRSLSTRTQKAEVSVV